jgi:hypothetical protein
MKFTTLFVLLQYIIGLTFALLGMFFFPDLGHWSLMASIFYSFLIGFFCMLTGVGLVGYFHLRQKRILHKFRKAMALSFVGLLLFLLFYIVIEKLIPKELGILIVFLPLTGAVFGFNLAATMTTNSETN